MMLRKSEPQWADKQYTKEEILENTERWSKMSSKEIVRLQFYQQRLCVPFDVFARATEEVLGRPVYTHEYAYLEDLQAEYEGRRDDVPTCLEDSLSYFADSSELAIVSLGEENETKS